MNYRAKFDAASFTLAGDIRNRTNKHTNKQTVTDISTPCLSTCVDNNLSALQSAIILRSNVLVLLAAAN